MFGYWKERKQKCWLQKVQIIRSDFLLLILMFAIWTRFKRLWYFFDINGNTILFLTSRILGRTKWFLVWGLEIYWNKKKRCSRLSCKYDIRLSLRRSLSNLYFLFQEEKWHRFWAYRLHHHRLLTWDQTVWSCRGNHTTLALSPLIIRIFTGSYSLTKKCKSSSFNI